MTLHDARSFRCKALLFDLDGVLVDSAECIERTWRAWAIRKGLDPAKVLAVAHGRRGVETVRIVAPGLSVDDELASLAESEATTSEGVYEIAGARELLDSLPGGMWGVVTSGIRAVAEFRIRYTRLPSPAVMVCADEIVRGKPDPEGYLKAAAGLDRSPSECVVIEDAPAGVEAAHAAGMRVIGITGTYPAEQLSAAEAVVGKLTDLSVVRYGDHFQINIHAPHT